MDNRSFALSALIAGLVMGLLGNLPLLNLVNCLLCAWVWLGGILAVYLYRRFNVAAPGLSMRQAAGLGVASGVVGALCGAVFSIIFEAILGSLGVLQSMQALQTQPGMPDFVQMLSAPGFHIANVLIDLVLYSLFGAAGGLLSVAVIWKAPKPAEETPA